MARENPSWGYTRLRGALENLGFDLGRSTIQRILAEHGMEPAPLRGRTMPWKTFLKAHWGAIAAADFFSVEVLTRGGLVRYLVLFTIDLKTSRVHVTGVTCRADREWMAQVARNLTDAAAGALTGVRHLIVDRDRLYTAHFQSLLQVEGVQLLRLPSRSPNLNAYAERLFGRSSTSASGTLSLWASITCVPSCASSWSIITSSATIRAWATSSPSLPPLRSPRSAGSDEGKGSEACSASTSEKPHESG